MSGSANEIQKEVTGILKYLPDFWFDWYARFLPGSVGIIIYLWIFGYLLRISPNYYLILVFISYLIGNTVQPIASFIVNDVLYKSKLSPRKAPLLSKAYAETVGMFSSSFISFLILIAYISLEEKPNPIKIISLIILILFFLFSMHLRAKATERKIRERNH